MARGRGEGAELVTPLAVAAAAADGTPQATEDRWLLRSWYLAVKSQINDEKDEMASADSSKFSAIFTQVESLHQLGRDTLLRTSSLWPTSVVAGGGVGWVIRCRCGRGHFRRELWTTAASESPRQPLQDSTPAMELELVALRPLGLLPRDILQRIQSVGG